VQTAALDDLDLLGIEGLPLGDLDPALKLAEAPVSREHDNHQQTHVKGEERPLSLELPVHEDCREQVGRQQSERCHRPGRGRVASVMGVEDSTSQQEHAQQSQFERSEYVE